MKRVLGLAALCIVTGFFFNGCASQTETSQTTQPSTSVPGEKRDGSDVTPGMGPSGPSANVRF